MRYSIYIAMFSLRQLQQFLAVVDSMSFRRAAERLNMAQPPLTAAIRQMENDLGVRLLVRNNRITGLTAAGQVLCDEARRTIAQAERTVLLTRRAGAGMVGSLRIGFVATAVRNFVPTLIKGFRETHPDVSLDLMEAPTARQVAALSQDRLDLGVVVLPISARVDPRIAIRTVLRSELVAALPGRHPLAAKPGSAVSLADLADEPWILFPADDGPGLHATILDACAVAGFTPRVVQRAVQMETTIGLVAAGLGVALVPRVFETAGWNDVVFRSLTGAGAPVRYELAFAWRSDDSSPALAALLSASDHPIIPGP
jgi:DNA-binding transcriptional LysR family regulator